MRADSEYFWPPPRPGPKRRSPEGTGIAQAQAVTRHRPISKLKLKVESHIRAGGRTDTVTDGRIRKVGGVVVAERTENRAAKGAQAGM